MTSPPSPTRRRSVRRIAGLAVLAAGAAVALSGCVALKWTSFQQQDRLGPINVVIKGCASDGTAACPNGTGGLSNEHRGGPGPRGHLGQRGGAHPRRASPRTSRTPGSSPSARPTPRSSPGSTRRATGSKWAGYISDAGTWTPGKEITVRIPVIRGTPARRLPARRRVRRRGDPRLARRHRRRPVVAARAVRVGPVQPSTPRTSRSAGTHPAGRSASDAFNEFVFLTPRRSTSRRVRRPRSRSPASSAGRPTRRSTSP